MPKLSRILLLVLCLPMVTAGPICEGLTCVIIYLGELLIWKGWILGIIIIFISLWLILISKKHMLPAAVCLVFGILLTGFSGFVEIRQYLVDSEFYERETEWVRNISYDVYYPSYLPQGKGIYRIYHSNFSTQFKITDTKAPTGETTWAYIHERKSLNLGCWFGGEGNATCKKISTLQDGSDLFFDGRSKYYVNKPGTEIYLDLNKNYMYVRDPSQNYSNGQEDSEVVKVMSSLEIITKQRLTNLVIQDHKRMLG